MASKWQCQRKDFQFLARAGKVFSLERTKGMHLCKDQIGSIYKIDERCCVF
jgi:hypothetical protein